MNARTAMLAYLAERSPGAYTEGDVVGAVQRSGRVTEPTRSWHADLKWLAGVQSGPLVGEEYDDVGEQTVFYALDAGKMRWRAQGMIHIP